MMLQNFLFSLNVVVPLFLCCILGYLARHAGLVEEKFVSGASNVVFYFALPANVFLNIAGCDLSENFNFSLIAFVVIAVLACALLLTLIVPHFIKDRKTSATAILCMFRGNFVILGVPLAISLMGTEGAIPTMITMPFAILSYSVISVLLLVVAGTDQAGNGSNSIKNALLQVIKNPLVIASLAGILFALFKIPLPQFADSTLGYFSSMCTGLGMFMLGAQMNVEDLVGRINYLIPISVIRLIAVPLVIVGLAALIGFRGEEIVCVYIFFAAPSAVNCYVLAGQMGGDERLAGESVLSTSCLATITLTLGIFLLKSLKLF